MYQILSSSNGKDSNSISTDFSSFYLNIPCDQLFIRKNKLLKLNKGKTTTKNLPKLKFTIEKNTNLIMEKKEEQGINSNNSKFSHNFTKSLSLNLKINQRTSILQFLQNRSNKKRSEDFSSTFE